jgi:serine protease AprX
LPEPISKEEVPSMTLTLSPLAWRPRAMIALVASIFLVAAATLVHGTPAPLAGTSSSQGAPAPTLAQIARTDPAQPVTVIVQFANRVRWERGPALVRTYGGSITTDLHIINGYGVSMTAGAAERLSHDPAIRTVSLNAEVTSQGAVDPNALATSYNQSLRSPVDWSAGYTGKGIGVAVIDTGIQGDVPDFRVSQSDATSRVIASAVTNPAATTAADTFGHGTHVAGLIAGNGTDLPATDPNYGKYAGVAPDANLIAIKAADDAGNASVLDVIDGLQFAVDHKADYNIRVVNLSLKSSVAESYKTDPLDAAAEAAWNSGIVVVAAAGNDGTAPDAVSYAPANDPYVITVGGVDDMGTKDIGDDALASWSSRGTTQDGFGKPDVLAPGAHMVSTMAPGAAYTQMCPTCIVGDHYFRVGGTSMAAAVVSGEVADLLQAFPSWSPNQVKAVVVKRSRGVDEAPADSVGEAGADKALKNPVKNADANAGLTPNVLLDATGQIDYTRASWSRASWSTAVDALRASWSRASWSRASWSRASWSATPESCSDFERASWSRASWSRASWSRASWSRASWSADGMSTSDLSDTDLAQIDAEIAAAKASCSSLLAQIDPARASWSRASWSRASWSSSFSK